MQQAFDYESALDLKHRKERGIYYSPDHLIRYVLDRVLEPRLARCHSVGELLGLKICDPACGAGLFLAAALDRVHARALRLSDRMSAERRALLRRKLARSCLFGADTDAEAVAICREAVSGGTIERADSLAERPFEGMSFDLVIGNPPYGTKLANSQHEALTRRFGLTNRQDSAAYFMALAQELAGRGGTTALIVPKSFIYASNWEELRARLLPGLVELVDCGKAWSSVRLEQVIYVHNAAKRPRAYAVSVRREDAVERRATVEKSDARLFGAIVTDATGRELALARQMLASGRYVSDVATNNRGAMLQRALEPAGKFRALGGKQVQRYAIPYGQKGFLAASDAKCKIEPGAILVQNIVAHVERPTPTLKIAATLASPALAREAVILDTVNQLKCRPGYSPKLLLAILNSRLMARYVHQFIVCGAIRTIHFDSSLTSRIPLPRQSAHPAIEALVDQMLQAPSEALDFEIERLVCGLFGFEFFGG